MVTKSKVKQKELVDDWDAEIGGPRKRPSKPVRSENGVAKSGPNARKPVPGAKPRKATEQPEEVLVGDYITVRDLANLMKRSPIDLIRVLMQFGIMAPITHSIDHDTAVIIGEELDVAVGWPTVQVSKEVEEFTEDEGPSRPKTLVQRILENEDPAQMQLRPPVVAVLGHVDHGKTTLLDRIRNAHVVDTEAGGITQRTGAYQVDVNGQKITFLDTPGHEAFTGMRARGAKVTDIVVLVVAADDGVMPQTKEAISHARAAGVQIIVALNKIDRPNANPQRVMEELAKEGLQSERWGGDTIVVPVSALHGEGVDDLLANILVVAELDEYKANPMGACVGTVIESEIDKSRGITATLLVQNGTLLQGDPIVCGLTWGRIRAMFDYEGKPIRQAGPSMPVVVLGLQAAPAAGDTFARVRSDRDAKRISGDRQDEAAAAIQHTNGRQMSLDDIFARFQKGDTKTLNLIVRADMQGTLEPVVSSLKELANDEIKVEVLQAAIGNIAESDVMLAEASDGVIIGFSVGIDRAAAQRAEASGVEVRHYDIIYKMMEDVQDALTGMLDPIYEDKVIGHATVRQLFKLRRGVIAGCVVTDGIVKRNAQARVVRHNKEIVPPTKIDTLRRFTEDAAEVRSGYECGIKLASGDDLLVEGDVIEIVEKQRVR